MSDDEIYEYLGQTFEWNRMKAMRNALAHDVRFPEAATVSGIGMLSRNSMKSTRTMRSATLLSDARCILAHYSVCMLSSRQEFELSAPGKLRRQRGETMKPNWEDDYEMPAEIDLTKGSGSGTLSYRSFVN